MGPVTGKPGVKVLMWSADAAAPTGEHGDYVPDDRPASQRIAATYDDAARLVRRSVGIDPDLGTVAVDGQTTDGLVVQAAEYDGHAALVVSPEGTRGWESALDGLDKLKAPGAPAGTGDLGISMAANGLYHAVWLADSSAHAKDPSAGSEGFGAWRSLIAEIESRRLAPQLLHDEFGLTVGSDQVEQAMARDSTQELSSQVLALRSLFAAAGVDDSFAEHLITVPDLEGRRELAGKLLTATHSPAEHLNEIADLLPGFVAGDPAKMAAKLAELGH
jgi:hypothetical protein